MFKSDSKVPIFHEKFLLESEFWKAEISVLATVHVTLQPEYIQYSRESILQFVSLGDSKIINIAPFIHSGDVSLSIKRFKVA